MPLPPRGSAPVRQTLSEAIYDRLLAAITAGELAPGEILNEKQLSEWLGGSRTPLREALQRLVNLGLVEMVPNRYTRVTPVDERVTAQCADTLFALYEHAARLAAPRLDTADLAELSTHADAIRGAGASGERAALLGSVHEYYALLSRRSGNGALPEALELMAPRVRRVLAAQGGNTAPALIAERLGAVHLAATAGDGEEAAAATRELTSANRSALDRLREAPDPA